MTPDEARARQALRTDLALYARACLKIRTKRGDIEDFHFNTAQQFIHRQLEAQKAKTGRVRALILKGRQQGCSTYIAARFYHSVTHRRGARVFILTHEQEATDNLFGMVSRYHENNNPLVKPRTEAANAKELYFDALDSGYRVGTAGTKAVGRSQTVQLFHGSEVAFWPNAQDHAAGVLQAVPDEEGTEIVLESTANGVGGLFHSMWQDAENGSSQYIAVFVPWFWQAEYRTAAPEGFGGLTTEEEDYQAAHGLTLDQMLWRRQKISELKSPELFAQEYPATAAEAFQLAETDSYIKSPAVLAARKATVEGSGPLIVGVDPARFGKDSTAIIRRRARHAFGLEAHHRKSTMEVVGMVARIIDQEKPRRVFVDVGGLGAGIYDRLAELGYGDVVEAVNFGSKPLDAGTEKGGPLNRRSEMWMALKAWIEDENLSASIPDDDGLHADLCAPRFKYDSNQRLQLEGKEAMMKRGIRSPDKADALALTFAAPVRGDSDAEVVAKVLGHYALPGRVSYGSNGGWMS